VYLFRWAAKTQVSRTRVRRARGGSSVENNHSESDDKLSQCVLATYTVERTIRNKVGVEKVDKCQSSPSTDNRWCIHGEHGGHSQQAGPCMVK
jgi:hypothetical protein